MTELGPFILITFSIFLTALVGFIVAVNGRLGKMEVKMAAMNEQVKPVWAQLQRRIAEELHHPHARYREMDSLLEDLEALQLTPTRRARLKELLLQRSKDMSSGHTDEERKSAEIMILVMDKVIIEADADATVVSKVVTVLIGLLWGAHFLSLKRWA